MSKLLFLIAFLVIPSAHSALEAFQLSEKTLGLLAEKGSPQIDQIEAAFYNTSVKSNEVDQEFAPEMFGKALYSETNERALIQFQPVFSPIKQTQLGVRKNFDRGVDTSVYFVTDQRSAYSPVIGKLRNATTTTVAFTAQIDIWKNIFGKISRARVESAELDKKRAEIEKDIQYKAFLISLRRVYWSLVANRESTLISEKLLDTAKKQLSEASARFKNSVAEADEVARYKAQLASREGTLLYLQYQKELLLKQLRNLLPELSNKEIVLENYDLEKTLADVMMCTATISQEKNVPYQYTHYDESIQMLKEIRKNNSLINSRYSDADVKLFGTVRSTGIGSDSVRTGLIRGNYNDSFNDHTEQNRTGYEVGVNFTLPLGSVKEDTQRVKELYDDKRLQASIHSADTQVITTHHQLSKSIALLTSVIKAQNISSSELSKRLQLMRKKYEQARVSVDQLVQDQDALLNSELITIESQLQILNTLFDYLVIYTETPCTFNRI